MIYPSPDFSSPHIYPSPLLQGFFACTLIMAFDDYEQVEPGFKTMYMSRECYNLISKGYSLSDISNLIKLPESIVSIQIETIISYFPNDNFDSLISVEEFELIKNSIEHDNDGLKDIKKRVPNNISYAKIRIVKAILFSSKTSSN